MVFPSKQAKIESRAMSDVIDFATRRASLLANKACASLLELLEVTDQPIRLPQTRSDFVRVKQRIINDERMKENVQYIDLVLSLADEGRLVLTGETT